MKVKELRKQGFRPIPGFEPLYIDKSGSVYNFTEKRPLTTNSKYQVIHNGKMLNVPKLILLVFAQQAYQSKRHIRFADRDKSNLEVANLSYIAQRQDIAICQTELMTAIRCYFTVRKRYKTRDLLQTRLYLDAIVHHRAFHPDIKGVEVFQTYIENPMYSKQRVAQMHDIKITECIEIVNQCIKMLLREILHDLDCGTLQIKDYLPRKKTTAQILKEYNENSGRAPIRLPKKQTTNEMLAAWRKHLESFENDIKTPD